MTSVFTKTKQDPGPNFQQLYECIFCNRKCAIVWDQGGVDPENPLTNKPAGLYITVNSQKAFVSAQDLVAGFVAELED